MLPIDEMLLDLRSTLEAFNDNTNYETFDKVLEELNRITNTCEDVLFGEEQ